MKHPIHVALLAILGSLQVSARAQCPEWDLSFANPGASGFVWAVARHADGSGGPASLYVAGDFTQIGGVAANRIARFDGTTWSALGQGLDSRVLALATYDDGTGPALYAAGLFTHAGGVPAAHVARWDGANWSGLGAGTPFQVGALAAFDDGLGLGPALYAGGSRWTLATGWTVTGNLTEVHDFAVFDDGTGAKLHACGLIGPTSANASPFVARWDGAQWSSLPPGGPTFDLIDDVAFALCAHDDGSGPALYVGGSFGGGFGSAYNRVARFDGQQWSPVGGGLAAPGDYSDVQDLAVHDDGSGALLYATGLFTGGGVQQGSGFARWNGQTWTPLAAGAGLPAGQGLALASHDDGLGPVLVFGGAISIAGASARNLARWRGPLNALAVSIVPPGYVIPVTVGDRVTLTAQVQGIGPFHYRWLKGLTPLGDGGPVQGSSTAVLEVEVVSPGFSAGSYACEVTNACITRASGVALQVQPGPGTPVCSGSVVASGCPCGNASVLGDTHGCLNSLGRGGWLAATGSASVASDTLVLRGADMTNGSVLYFQGTDSLNAGAGSAFGDGLRCAGGAVARLGLRFNANGGSTWPGPSDPPLSSAISAGQSRTYQAWYRDALPYCTSATWNLTNGVRVTWQP